MPNSNEQLAYSILRANNIAVLRRIGYKEYVFFGDVPDFYTEIFPSSQGDKQAKHTPDEAMLDYFELVCVTPWDYSPMLEIFLEEAEEFFNDGRPGSISSGVWQEDGRVEEPSALIAKAVRFGEEQLLIIRLLREEFIDRANILRKARVQLLENRKMSKSLELFKEKSKISALSKVLDKADFMAILQNEMEKAQITSTSLALIILNIDDFKQVNDTYGYEIGDKVLESFEELLLNSMRRNDIVARYSDEEFAVLVPRSTGKQAGRIAEKLCLNIAETPIVEISLTASLGYTLLRHEESAQDFIMRAILAMREAKKRGKNRTCAR